MERTEAEERNRRRTLTYKRSKRKNLVIKESLKYEQEVENIVSKPVKKEE